MIQIFLFLVIKLLWLSAWREHIFCSLRMWKKERESLWCYWFIYKWECNDVVCVDAFMMPAADLMSCPYPLPFFTNLMNKFIYLKCKTLSLFACKISYGPMGQCNKSAAAFSTQRPYTKIMVIWIIMLTFCVSSHAIGLVYAWTNLPITTWLEICTIIKQNEGEEYWYWKYLGARLESTCKFILKWRTYNDLKSFENFLSIHILKRTWTIDF